MTNDAIDISFCIPTYNFGAYIGATLDSITEQADDRIEIVIVDGGSTDNTAEIVAQKKRGFPHIKFIQRQKRCGVDADILESVVQATGQYCWLFSSDDLIAEGAIAALRQAMALPWDVLVANFVQCDIEMRPLRPGRVMDVVRPTTFDWAHPRDRARLLHQPRPAPRVFQLHQFRHRAPGLAGAATPVQSQFVGSCWIIAAQIFAMAPRRPGGAYYEPAPLVLRQGDNDLFSSNGLLKRTLSLSINGFRDVGEHCFRRRLT